MRAADTSAVLRRVGRHVRHGDVQPLNAATARLVLRALLFDGDGVPGWHALAACGSSDGEFFRQLRNSDAKQVCAGCPVRARCLEDAMSWELSADRYGVAGGLTADERTQLYRDGRERAA
jgi:WhiB family redox-sensing transcriptional regulator